MLGGALLLPLGVLLFIPSRTHRLMGLLALCAAMAVTAGVLSRVGQAQWNWATSAAACGARSPLRCSASGGAQGDAADPTRPASDRPWGGMTLAPGVPSSAPRTLVA